MKDVNSRSWISREELFVADSVDAYRRQVRNNEVDGRISCPASLRRDDGSSLRAIVVPNGCSEQLEIILDFKLLILIFRLQGQNNLMGGDHW